MQSSNGHSGEDRSEFEGVQRQINEKTNESLESTRRMVNMVAESQDIGIATMGKLDEQGEQLHRIEVKSFNSSSR